MAEADAAHEGCTAADAVARGVSRVDCEPVEDAEGAIDAVWEANGDSDTPAEGVCGLGDSVALPVADFAKAESVGHTVCGNTLLVGVNVPGGEGLECPLSLAVSDGNGGFEAPELPLCASVVAPLPLPGGLDEGCEALAEALLRSDEVDSALTALLLLLRRDSCAVDESLAVAAGDGVAAALPVPSDELYEDAVTLLLTVAHLEGELLAELCPESLPEIGADKEGSTV